MPNKVVWGPEGLQGISFPLFISDSFCFPVDALPRYSRRNAELEIYHLTRDIRPSQYDEGNII